MAHTSIFQQKGTTVEIHEKDFLFYPTHISMILKLRKFSQEIVDGVMGFMAKDPTHYAGKTFKEGNTIINDVSQEKISIYQSTRKDGMKSVLDALLKTSNMEILAELVCDSLREESFTSEDLLRDGDIETLMAFAMGLFEANSSILDPIAGRLQAMQSEETEEAPQATDEK